MQEALYYLVWFRDNQFDILILENCTLISAFKDNSRKTMRLSQDVRNTFGEFVIRSLLYVQQTELYESTARELLE